MSEDFQRVFDLVKRGLADDSNESKNAISIAKTLMAKNDFHSDDIGFYDNREGSMIRRTSLLINKRTKENEVLLLQINFLKKSVDEKTLRQMAKISNLSYRWFEFQDKVEKRMGELPVDWESTVCSSLEISKTVLNKWRDGFDEIPEDAFDNISKIAKIKKEVPIKEEIAISPSDKNQSKGFPWYSYPEVELEVCKKFLAGTKLTTIAEYITDKTGLDITSNQINAKLYNSPPPKSLIYSVRSEGPTDWAEMWLIGHVLTKVDNKTNIGNKEKKRERGWLKPIQSRINDLTVDHRNSIKVISKEQIASLRKEFNESHVALKKNLKDNYSSVPPWASEFADKIKNYGKDGVQRETITAMNPKFKRRTVDLLRFNLVFETLDNGQQVLVHSDFKELWDE